jgi:PIN like domain
MVDSQAVEGWADSEIGDRSPTSTADDTALRRVWRVLNRMDSVESLRELRNGLEPSLRPSLEEDASIAFGFDTNAIFRLGLGPRGPDAIDYLRSKHGAPVIVPGQVIQEVWNNLLAAVEPQARKLRKKFDELNTEMESIDQTLGSPGEAVRESIEELIRVHGDWIDPASQETFGRSLEVLINVGETSYVPRSEFAELARVRKETKTPPGFQDAPGNYGDFYLWADFLYGIAKTKPSSYDAIVLVTNDLKSDWSRHGVEHPLLVAEAGAVAAVPFRLWKLEEFHAFVKEFST